MTKASVLKANIDCRSLIEADLGPPAKRSSKEWTWHCPNHKDKTASLAANFSRWKCFGACGKGGDIFDWIQDRRGMSFPQAMAYVSEEWTSQVSTQPLPVGKTLPNQPQTAELQSQMLEAMADCAVDLWRMPEAKEYLMFERGLSNWTIEEYLLGYHPINGTVGGLYMPAGYTIPHFQEDVCTGIKIRCLEGSSNKYYVVPGSTSDLYLTESLKHRESGQPFTSAFLVEGEFDALLLGENIGKQAGVVTFCSASHREIGPWLQYLTPLQHIFVVTDNDPAGESAAAFYRTKLPQTAVRVLPPAGAKDITDAWKKLGGVNKGSQDLREWALGILAHEGETR